MSLGIITNSGTPNFTAISRAAAEREELVEFFDRHHRRTATVSVHEDFQAWEEVHALYEHFAGSHTGPGLVSPAVDWVIYLDL
jgi:hypothetical protein